jgi:hypothetical protein
VTEPDEPSWSNSLDASLSQHERTILDTFSGTSDDPEPLNQASLRQAQLRATVAMPNVPHIDELLAVLAAAGQNIEPVAVDAFLSHGVVEVPGTDESYTVRSWLESGRPPEPVMQLASHMKFDP